MILQQSDRIMITGLIGPSETGIYSLIYNLSMIVSVFIVLIEGVWLPWYTNKMKIRDIDVINKNVKLYISGISYLVIMITLVSPEILRILAPEEYWQGEIIIPPLVISSYIVFIYTLYVNVEHFHKKTMYIALNTIVAAMSNIILNLIFIPLYGFHAAAFTTLISYLLSLYFHYKFAKKLEKDLYPFKIFYLNFLLILFIGAIFYIYLDFLFLRWFIASIISLILLSKHRNTLIKALNINK